MNENGKLIHSITGAIAAWLCAGWAWLQAHAGTGATILAFIATLYSIRASRETIKLRKRQQARLTDSSSKEPETDL